MLLGYSFKSEVRKLNSCLSSAWVNTLDMPVSRSRGYYIMSFMLMPRCQFMLLWYNYDITHSQDNQPP